MCSNQGRGGEGRGHPPCVVIRGGEGRGHLPCVVIRGGGRGRQRGNFTRNGYVKRSWLRVCVSALISYLWWLVLQYLFLSFLLPLPP